MTKLPLKNSFWVTLIPLFFALASCTKMDKTLGEDFVPADQKLQVQFHFGDYFTMDTVRLDSLSTDAFSLGTLGCIENEMGKTRAGFVSQFEPYSFDYDDIGYGATGFDSVFLRLYFSSTYGAGAASMDIKVYELNEAIYYDSTYYGTPEFVQSISNATPINVGGTTRITADSTYAYIKLSDDIGERLWKSKAAADSAKSFKGLYVMVENTSGTNIKYVDLVNTSSAYANSALLAYYTYQDTSANKDSATFYPFTVYNNTPRFNVYEHDYSTATMSGDALYMQGFCGIVTKMDFDTATINAWKGSRHLAVSRAELILQLEDDNNPAALDWYVTQLRCMTRDSVYRSIRGNFYTYNGSTSLYPSFDGAINRSLMQYSLNITHFFNDVLKGNAPTMYIVPYSYTTAANSAKVMKSGARKPQLKITYTEIK